MQNEHLLQIERAYTRLLSNTYVLLGVVHEMDHAPEDFVACVLSMRRRLARIRVIIEEARRDDDGTV